MPSFLPKIDVRRLHNHDMKKLVRILRDVPAPTEVRYKRKLAKYRESTKEEIQRLPSRLRFSRLSLGSTNLCSIHKGLNQHLVNELFEWLQHEIEGAIGKFLYPLIMSDRLTEEQELKIRQLEPVLQMWRSNFNLETSAPPGREPIRCGSKWHYQEDQCPACIMARIGSDEGVLLALFAGMVGRFKTKTLTTMDTLRIIAGWDKPKSKRLRFVRYWVKKTTGGTDTLFEAGDLGTELKCLRFEWKREQRRLRHVTMPDASGQRNEEENPQTVIIGPDRQGRRSRPAPVDATRVQQLYELPTPYPHDPKLGPDPRPRDAKCLSPVGQLGFEMPSMRERVSVIPYDQLDVHPALRPSEQQPDRTLSNGSTGSDDTIKPEDSVSVVAVAALCVKHLDDQQAENERCPVPSHIFNASRSSHRLHTPDARCAGTPSLVSTHTILSYDGGPSSPTTLNDPLDNPIYNAIETEEQRLEKYRRLLASHPESDPYSEDAEDDVTMLPTPRPQSMYSAFGNMRFDGAKFDVFDEEGD